MCKKKGMTLVNAEDCCEGLWTRKRAGEVSVLDYFLVNDKELVRKMEIDEDKHKTPYWINEENNLIYSDHCTMILSTSMSVKNKEKTCDKGQMTSKGYEKFCRLAEERNISSILNTEDFQSSYTSWSNEVMKLVTECSTRKRKSKGWKVNRNLLQAKKLVKTELIACKDDLEKKNVYKMRKALINEHIEKEHQKKASAQMKA